MRLSIFIAPALIVLAGCSALPNGDEIVRVNTAVGSKNAQQLTRTGIRYVGQGKMQLAEASFKNAIRGDRSHGPAHNNLGRVYFQRGDLRQAAEAFSWAMEFMPDRAEPVNNLGLVFESAGKLDKSIELFRKAHDADQDNAEYLANLVRARLRRGDRGKALRDEMRALKFIETRPEWSDWVNERLATGNTED